MKIHAYLFELFQ